MPVNNATHDHSRVERVSPEAVAMLREALRKWVASESADDSALGTALRTVAAEARDRGIRAEELLVTLKTTWFEVGGTPTTPSSPSDHRRLDELVTACIKAYYDE
jgi:hypothetical protein